MNELSVKDQYRLKDNAPPELVKSLELMKSADQFRDLPEWEETEQGKFTALINSIAFDMGSRNQISIEESKRIYTHVKRHFPDINLNEFKEAFSLYQALKLDFQKEFFQSFDLMFTASVLSSFRRYRINQQRNYEHFKQTQTQTNPLNDFGRLISFWNLSLKTGQYQIPDNISAYYFVKLEELGIIEFPLERKKEIHQDQNLRSDFVKERQKKAKLFTIKENMGQWKNYCRTLAFKEWASEKLFDKFDLEKALKDLLSKNK